MNLTRRSLLGAAAGTTAALALSACGEGEAAPGPAFEPDNKRPLTVLIGSSGDAETDAVVAGVKSWSDQSGTPAKVTVAADPPQQLAQGFSAGNPPDLFYVSGDLAATYAGNGALEPFVAKMPNKDAFYPASLQTYTINNQTYGAPKDFGTVALIINTEMWEAAGLTEADVPKTWEQLEAAATKLTTDKRPGLVTGGKFEVLGAFMVQAGGWMTNAEGKAQVNTPENLTALTFVQRLLKAGCYQFESQVGVDWGGAAFGKQLTAMTIEGPWIVGALRNDYPKVKYQVAKLPAGPKGEGTLRFDGAWGMASQGKNKGGALALAVHLTQPEQQLAFAKAFGVIPALPSVAEQWKAEYPQLAAFQNQVDFSKAIPSVAGITQTIGDFNSKMAKLQTSDPKSILDAFQTNLAALPGMS